MEMDHKEFVDIEEELEKIKQNLNHTPIRKESVISHQTHCVKNIVGSIKLEAAFHYGLILECESSKQTIELPLVLVDAVNNVHKWISVIGKKVWINKLLIVFERFEKFGGCQDVDLVSTLIMWKDVQIMEGRVDDMPGLANSTSCVDYPINNSRKGSRVMVHHVSLPLYIDQPIPVCLVLISYINKNAVVQKLWLVLQGEQVAWKDFLVPNREYIVEVPQENSQSWIDECRQSLKKIFAKDNSVFDVLFHHIHLFATLDGVLLPYGSKLYLTANTQFSKFVYQFVPDTLSIWFSSSEADYADVGLVTCFGQIDLIKYDLEDVYKSCYLCTRTSAIQPSVLRPSRDISYPWTNPWTSTSSVSDILLPTTGHSSGVMRTGVPGKLVQILKLRDVKSGKEQSVYLKHSYMSSSQDVFRLAPGMVVCLSYMNRRRSSRGNYYYTTTVLSALRVLAVPHEMGPNFSESWGVYGMNHSANHDRMWGVLETINLQKVTITARCAQCGCVFSKGTCNDDCTLPSADTSATAISWFQVIQNGRSITMEKVVIKDNLVRELLCIPEGIWQSFLQVALQEELICFFSEQNLNGPTNSSHFCELFKMYCLIPKPNGKFYISVKKMFSHSGNKMPFYYCIYLKPVDEDRLKIVAELSKSCLST